MIGALVQLADDQRSEMSRLIDDAGPIAGLFVLALGAVMVLLWFSLRKQMKKIDPSLPMGEHDEEEALDQQLTAEAVERGESAGDEQAGR